jgi:hypothetical protein
MSGRPYHSTVAMSERAIERAKQRDGAEGSLVHQSQTVDDPLRRSLVHQ